MDRRPYIAGSGSFVPAGRVTNEEYMAALRPVNPKTGQIVAPEWLEKHFGIKTRAYDARFPQVEKSSRERGGLYDGDMAVMAARRALEDAGVKAQEIDVLVHVSCTPDTVYCSDHFRHITSELGLRPDAGLTFHNLGCAGLVAGLRNARDGLLGNGDGTIALLVASNCPSGYLSRETLAYYTSHPDPWAWLSPAVFGDGAGALVLRLNGGNRGFVRMWYETHPETVLISYPAGGCLEHTGVRNVGRHLFLMDPQAVGAQYLLLMQRNMEELVNDWPRFVEPVVGWPFDVKRVARWYMHQANGPAVLQTAAALGIPLERAPINIDRYGNTSAASTILLLDEDRRGGRVKGGDVVVFLWIGAGNGAMNGYAVCAL